MTITLEKLQRFVHAVVDEHGEEVPMFTLEKEIAKSFGMSINTMKNYKALLQKFNLAIFNSSVVKLKDKLIGD